MMQLPCPRVELTPSKSRAKLEFRAATSEAQRLRPWYWREIPFRRALAALAVGVTVPSSARVGAALAAESVTASVTVGARNGRELWLQ